MKFRAHCKTMQFEEIRHTMTRRAQLHERELERGGMTEGLNKIYN